ncbi:choline/glycine/proline betaine transport protein [Pseudidiomarina planktonica]|uniref:Choline/glycine/proline betaine transport protein n=1 Tax=Pseudidiomarina planktonica TaxID=1323738 RepID=A0A1Y6G008_9GAMM|nr:BCCT family transporter [Pseudidiomarina planktonica]RUO62852.1 BCCT family transporter [Pseudidiomarina planktonica]SMQ80735.1 choline/glycine/proline betaine transport protein [Pseudidiomarina planktonica]
MGLLQNLRKTIVIHPQVFFTSVAIILIFVLGTVFNLETAQTLFNATKDGITANFGWFLILAVQLFLVFAIYLAVSRFRFVRIGGNEAKSDYSFLTWLSMLFSAGMGIGLMFWAVAEPIFHYTAPPDMEGVSLAAATRAMDITFLHWGLHAWAIYAVIGLTLAYFTFNRGMPLSIRSAFYPLLGDKIYGFWGNVVDILAVVATLFGVATSLGLGVSQVNAGLNEVFGVTQSVGVQVGLIAAITGLATISVLSGLDGGIKRLSQLNLSAAALLLLFVIALGPTLFILKMFVQSTGHYLQNLLELSSWAQAYQQDTDWQSSWTVFYWAWWIGWSPFVGVFIARISKGRTIKEFILGVLLVPSAMTFLWMSGFGGTAIWQAMNQGGGIVDAVNADYAMSLFAMLEALPWSFITSLLAMLLVVVFFVTSSDSGSLVIDMLSSGGNMDPPKIQRVFWALLEGVVAAVLLLAGGLSALQAAAISTGLPFTVVLMLMAVCLYKALREDYTTQHIYPRVEKESPHV